MPAPLRCRCLGATRIRLALGYRPRRATRPASATGDAQARLSDQVHQDGTGRVAFATSDIDPDGGPDRPIPFGIAGMQRESETAAGPDAAQPCQPPLARRLNLVRAALHRNDRPSVLGSLCDSGRVADRRVWDGDESVRKAPGACPQADLAARLAPSTHGCRYADPWLDDSTASIFLGRPFADDRHQLPQVSP